MKNKCPKCGSKIKSTDIFCSQCGNKIERTSDNSTDIYNNSENNDVQPIPLYKKILNFGNDNPIAYMLSSKNISFDNVLTNIIICMVLISIALTVVMFSFSGGHNDTKSNLQYNSYIQNPERIPELSEPVTFEQFADNIKSVENFLDLFLSYSKESDDKNEQIFISYLNEMDKLTHITSEITPIESSECSSIDSYSGAKICVAKLNKVFAKTGVMPFYDNKNIYLYPDYKFIKNKYSKYFSSEIKNYLKLRAKYNIPVVSGLVLNIKPDVLVQKVLEFEKLYLKSSNPFVKDSTEEILFNDFRQLVFNPSVYATTTHEITKYFKVAYKKLSKHKKSAFSPVIKSCLEKGRLYTEQNFKNDYPYKYFVDTFEENVANSNFSDIFAQLRKNIIHDNTNSKFSYIFSLKENKWTVYEPNSPINASDYVIGEPDSNNNVPVYSNTFSLIDEVNISKYSYLFLSNNQLYVFNRGRLQISKVFFNGRNFSLRTLSNADVTSVFPGVEVINIDSYSNYNIYLEKYNKNASFIILSRYSQGYENYVLSNVKGTINNLKLPNMFNVDSLSDVVVSFHNNSISPDTTSESTPTYKFTIHTQGQSKESNEKDYYKYDEQTANNEDTDEKYYPNIIPKLDNNKNNSSDENIDEKLLAPPPKQKIEIDDVGEEE